MRKARLLWCLSILLIALLVVSVITVFLITQQVDDAGKLRLEWQQVLPGVEGWSIIQTSDGGYLVLGKNASIIKMRYDDYFENYVNVLVKTDSEGNILWQKNYPHPNDRRGIVELIETTDGGYALVGSAWLWGSGLDPYYFVKTDAEGNILWNKTYAGPSLMELHSVNFEDFLQINDGSYIIIGSYLITLYKSSSCYYLKVDSSGKLQINMPLTVGAPISILTATDEAFVILSRFLKSVGSWSFGLVKIDYNGTKIWQKEYTQENSKSSSGWCGIQTSDGGFILCGVTNFDSHSETWIIKTDSQGNMLWNRTYAEVREINSIGQTSDGGYIICGRPVNAGLTHYGEGDVWIAKTDALGNIEAQIKTGGPALKNSYAYIRSILQVSDGGYVCVGTLNRASWASPEQKFWIAKFSSR